MTRLKKRFAWGLPILVLAVVLAVVLLSGTVSGAPTTLSTTSVPGGGVTSAFDVKAADLGYFDAATPTISSPSAIVVNMSTGRVLFSKKADTHRPMASTTKIMTATIALQSVPLDQKVTISHDAAVAWDEKPFLKEGDVLTVEQLLSCMLVHSSNGSAIALAQAVAGSTDAFVVKMNAKAQELGMTNTHYMNPNGLDTAGHYSTAADISVLARYAMQNAEFRKLVSQKSYTLVIPGRSEPTVFDSTNKLMLRASWVNGIKTGLTPKADQCLVASGTKDGVTMVSVILGQPVTNVCWDESQSLLEYGLAQYKHVTFLKSGVTVAEAAIPYSSEKLHLITKSGLEMDLFKGDEVAASVRIDKQLTLPVRAGQKCGTIILSMRGQTVASVDLVSDKSVGKITLGTKISSLWHRLAD